MNNCISNFWIIGIGIFLIVNISSAQQYNISVAKPKVKATENQYELRKIIEGSLNEAISKSNGYVTLINRTDIEEIESRRKKIAKRNKDLNLAAGTMKGVDYILNSKASNIKITSDSLVVKKNVSGKLVPKTVYSKHFSFDLDLSFVSVEDGTILAQSRIVPSGFAYQSDVNPKMINKEMLYHEAVLDSRDCLRSLIDYMILQSLPVQIPVLHIHKSKKKEAKEIIIQGGKNSPIRPGVKFDILKIYMQEIGGQSILRQEKIGEAKFEELLIGTSRCKIKKGGKEVFQAMEAREKIVLVTTDLKEKETCGLSIQSRERRSKKASFSKARTSDETPKKDTSKTKRKTKKKVKRKN